MKTPFSEVTLLASCQLAGLLVGAAIFAILFVAILDVLKQYPPFASRGYPR